MNHKLISWIIVFLFFLGITYAQCGTQDNPCEDNWDAFDYNNPKADITQVPADQLDVEKAIQAGKGEELTSEQIAHNLNKFDDLSELNQENAAKAIYSEYGVNVDMNSRASIRSGRLIASNGQVTLSGNNYKNGLLMIDEDGNIKFIPNKDKESLKIPDGDTVNIETNKMDVMLQTSHDTSVRINGKIRCTGMKCHIPAGSKTTIGSVKFSLITDDLQIYINDPSFEPEEHKHESYYYKTDNGMILHSSEHWYILAEFLEGDEILNTDKMSLLKILVENGDGINIKKGEPPKVLHMSSEKGRTVITNDGLKFEFNKDKIKLLPSRKLTYKDLKSGKFKSVAFEMESNSDNVPDKIQVDSFGKLSMLSNDGKERIVVEEQGYSQGLHKLEKEDLDKIITKVVEVSGESAEAALMFALPAALEAGLTPEQTVEVITKVIEASGRYSKLALESVLPAILRRGLEEGLTAEQTANLINNVVEASGEFAWPALIASLPAALGAGLTPEQTVDVITKVVEASGESSVAALMFALPAALEAGLTPEQTVDVITKVVEASGESAWPALTQSLPAALDAGLTPEQSFDIISKVVKAAGEGSGLALAYHLPEALKEYNKNNLEEIKQGAIIASKYIHYEGIKMLVKGETTQTGFIYSNIKDKESLAKECTDFLNSNINKKKMNSNDLSRAAVLINKLHDNENVIDHSDTMREQIARDLSFESKYNLIAKSNADLYQSTFEKIYDHFPEETVNEIRNVDPDGKSWAAFAVQLGERDKLNELASQDSDFIRDAVDIAITDSSKLEENTASLANTFIEFYEKPAYSKEKSYFEEKLVELYKGSENIDEKASYAYLIKLNEKASNQEFKDIHKMLPALPDVSVPKCSGDTCIGKQYFYRDENWFEITKKAYTNPDGIYKYNIVEETKDSAVLEQKVNGKTMRMILTYDKADAGKVLNDDETILVVHRGHSYNSKETFQGSSDKTKVIIDGGCGGPGRAIEFEKQYPNSQLIYDKNTGQGAISQYEAHKVLRRIAIGQTEWEQVRDDTEQEAGLSLPDDKNRLLLRYKELIN